MFGKNETPAGEPPEELPADIEVVLADPPPAVSVVTLAGELEEPVDVLVHRLGPDVFIEERSGLRCVDAATCRRLLDERRDWWERLNKDRETERVEREPVSTGTPAVEGLSALESLRAVAGHVLPSTEFGRPKPNFLDAELAEGQRRLNESRRT